MYALVLLALLGTSPPGEKPDRWIPLPSNPALEIYGREDASGQFRYSAMRRIQAPVTNYGVSLPALTASSPSHDLRGTDHEISAELVKEAMSQEPSGAAETEVDAPPPPPPPPLAVCAHSDCPNDRCDRKKPEPPPEAPEFKLPEIQPLHVLGAVVGLAVSLLGLLILVVLIVLCIKFALYLTSGKAES